MVKLFLCLQDSLDKFINENELTKMISSRSWPLEMHNTLLSFNLHHSSKSQKRLINGPVFN